MAMVLKFISCKKEGNRSRGKLIANWWSQLQLETLSAPLKDLKDQAEDVPFWKSQPVCSLRVDTNLTALSQSINDNISKNIYFSHSAK